MSLFCLIVITKHCAWFVVEGQLGCDLLLLLPYHSRPLTTASVLAMCSPSSLSVSLTLPPDQGATAGAGWGPWQPAGPSRAALSGAAVTQGRGWQLQPENGPGAWCPVPSLHLLQPPFPGQKAETLEVHRFSEGKNIWGNPSFCPMQHGGCGVFCACHSALAVLAWNPGLVVDCLCDFRPMLSPLWAQFRIYEILSPSEVKACSRKAIGLSVNQDDSPGNGKHLLSPYCMSGLYNALPTHYVF